MLPFSHKYMLLHSNTQVVFNFFIEEILIGLKHGSG